eukprot:6204357-Pleurochrysis_carterae.AAC.3
MQRHGVSHGMGRRHFGVSTTGARCRRLELPHHRRPAAGARAQARHARRGTGGAEGGAAEEIGRRVDEIGRRSGMRWGGDWG